MTTTRRWQDWVNLVLGLWLFTSPWILGYAGASESAAWNAYALGVVIALFAAVAVYTPMAWEELVNMAFGIWMIVSPWVLGFASHLTATYNAVIVGALVTAFAVWAMVEDDQFAKWWRDHHLT